MAHSLELFFRYFLRRCKIPYFDENKGYFAPFCRQFAFQFLNLYDAEEGSAFPNRETT